MMDFFLDGDESTSQYQSIVSNKESSSNVEDSGNAHLNKIFTAIRSNLSAELVKKTGATFQFNITGKFILHSIN